MGRPPAPREALRERLPVRRRGAERSTSRCSTSGTRPGAAPGRSAGAGAGSRPGRRERVLPGVVDGDRGGRPGAAGQGRPGPRRARRRRRRRWRPGSPATPLAPVERYLARATLQAPLVALGPTPARPARAIRRRGASGTVRAAAAPPQLSFRGHDGDPLVSGRRAPGLRAVRAQLGLLGQRLPGLRRDRGVAAHRLRRAARRAGGRPGATTATAQADASRTCASRPARRASAT